MKTKHWAKLRLELAARKQRLTESLRKYRGNPATVKTVVEKVLYTEDGHKIVRDGEPVTVCEEIELLTPRGRVLAALRAEEASRAALVRASHRSSRWH